ncbi:glycosidase [Rathayibacter sp. Leaf185]|nr:glycosidase [Rathayibacter sp. Leaf294]KQS10725.1 glycosidase [Rathayibacter sp. Leaf185]
MLPSRTTTALSRLSMTRVGVIMSPDPANPLEAEGVLNPASATRPDGTIELFPRIVAAGNRSRVGSARVLLDVEGVPIGVHRTGVVLEADRAWEHGLHHGGVEDPRITRIDSLDCWVMTYVAFGPLGPSPALAISSDLDTWKRLGPLMFDYDDTLNTDLNLFPNKDVVVFPEIVPAPDGTPSFAMLHRPMWDLHFSRNGEPAPLPTNIPDDRQSIWISYTPANRVLEDIRQLTHLSQHRFVAGPMHNWEAVKIGAGPAPIRTNDGWVVIHHGVAGTIVGSVFEPQQHLTYAAGALLLDLDDPSRLVERSEHPLLAPSTEEERSGTVANVVFPTAVETVDGISYVFYGMADAHIGVARLDGLSR